MDERTGADDEAIVLAVYDAFKRRDLPAALIHLAEDVEIELAATQRRVGQSEPYRGHDGMRRYFEDVARVWEGLELHVGHLHRTRRGVMVLGKVTAVEDGRRTSRRAVWTWQLRDGRVTHIRAEDLGEAVPTPGPVS